MTTAATALLKAPFEIPASWSNYQFSIDTEIWDTMVPWVNYCRKEDIDIVNAFEGIKALYDRAGRDFTDLFSLNYMRKTFAEIWNRHDPSLRQRMNMIEDTPYEVGYDKRLWILELVSDHQEEVLAGKYKGVLLDQKKLEAKWGNCISQPTISRLLSCMEFDGYLICTERSKGKGRCNAYILGENAESYLNEAGKE